ncbi:MAG: GIY-YIG nuclease family protein [Pseudomonadota bacterium]
MYLLRCADGTLYCGSTCGLERRLAAHNGVLPGGARYTRGRRPVVLVYREAQPDRAAAARREAELKRLDRAAKLRLVAQFPGAPP